MFCSVLFRFYLRNKQRCFNFTHYYRILLYFVSTFFCLSFCSLTHQPSSEGVFTVVILTAAPKHTYNCKHILVRIHKCHHLYTIIHLCIQMLVCHVYMYTYYYLLLLVSSHLCSVSLSLSLYIYVHTFTRTVLYVYMHLHVMLVKKTGRLWLVSRSRE